MISPEIKNSNPAVNAHGTIPSPVSNEDLNNTTSTSSMSNIHHPPPRNSRLVLARLPRILDSAKFTVAGSSRRLGPEERSHRRLRALTRGAESTERTAAPSPATLVAVRVLEGFVSRARETTLVSGSGIVGAIGAVVSESRDWFMGDARTALGGVPKIVTGIRVRSSRCGVAWLRDGKHFASAGDDANVTIRSLSDESTRVLRGHGDGIRALLVAKDCLVSGGYDHAIKVWEGETMSRTMDHGEPVEGLAWLEEGRIAIAARGRGAWDVREGRVVAEDRSHAKTVSALCVANTPGGIRVLTGGLDGLIRVYDRDLNLLHGLDHGSPVSALAFSVDARAIAIGSTDGMVSVRKRQAESVTLRGGCHRARCSRPPSRDAPRPYFLPSNDPSPGQ